MNSETPTGPSPDAAKCDNLSRATGDYVPPQDLEGTYIGPCIEQRLAMFLQICQAVQHAHLKGIIHRDLKPSNVLVALTDGRPVPKVIDFGLAKAMHQPLTDRTMFTNFGTLLGTLEYMSPEQADLGALDIDTRTDVYSLGSMLYELLTGTTPLSDVQLRRQSYAEAIRLIRENEPLRPSERVAKSGRRLPELASERHTDPARLCKSLRGDLDWIVMKAIDKNRAARYQTASELAADVERYLKHQPIVARPPSFWYPAQKFMLRHRTAVVVTGVFLLLLIGATAVSTWLALRASAAEKEARASAAIAQAVNDFLREDVLGQANPMSQLDAKEKPDPDMKLRTALDHAAARIPGRFPDQPLVDAAIRETIGEAYYELSVFPAAETHLQASFDLLRKHRGEEHPQTMDVRKKLAVLGKLQAHEEALTALLPYYRRQFGDTHKQTIEVLNSLGLSYLDQKKFNLAEPILLQVYEGRRKTLGEEAPETLNSLNCLGYLYMKQDRFDQAEPYYVKSLELRRKVLSAKHPHTEFDPESGRALRGARQAGSRGGPLPRSTRAQLRDPGKGERPWSDDRGATRATSCPAGQNRGSRIPAAKVCRRGHTYLWRARHCDSVCDAAFGGMLAAQRGH